MAKKKSSSVSNDLGVSKKDAMMYSQVLMGGAVVAVVLAGLGYMGTDLWLASTQWLLVSAVLALFGIYLKMR
jgi:small-conductance mechanosensitive channel